MRPMNSARVLASRRNVPTMLEVTIVASCFFTPRIIVHRCVASMTHANALRLELLHQEVGHLHGEPLLDLQPLRVHVDDARDLRQADDPAARQVADVRPADERAAGGARRG